MKAYRSGGVAPLILNFGTKWTSVRSFTLRPLTPWQTAPGSHWI